MQVLQYVYSKYEEYVVGECFDETTPLEGKVYIVTGANTGLGFHTAAELAHMGATVVMACRTPAKAQAARDLILQGRSNEMRTPKKEMIAPSKVIILPLDLNSFDSVREFVASFKKLQLPLHGLINNAGMMSAERSETSDNSGLETVMTANHLSPFLLTNLLLPELNATAHRELQALRIRKGHESHSGDVAQQSSKSKKAAVGKKSEASAQDSEVQTSSTGPTQADIDACYGRIINVASALHKSTKAFNFDDIMSEKNYSLFGTYAQSKLANVLFTCELQERFDRLSHGKPLDDQILVVANCVHPGCVRTEVTRNMSPLVQLGNNLAAPIMCWFQKTALQGCYTSVFTAISPEAVETDEYGQRGGGYYFHCEKCAMGPGVNATDAKRLWMVSEAYVEQKFM
jgi:NAD(P)-dependent dehydrogenase (short-subunit alcohol dehydrogenase family)